ncbi:MAG: type II toxin-antitoxin system VapB family antitoxin [Archangium sp.]|nr:type II toxin-antitoxin system VapB family antitoxin [Archangium sp.]
MRTTLNIDTEAFEEAARVLRTEGLSATVNAALREVVAATKRARLVDRIRKGDLPVPTPAERERLRVQALPTGTLGRKR